MVGKMGVALLEVMEFIDDDSEEMDEIEGSREEKLLPTTEDAEDVLPSPLIIPWKVGILLGVRSNLVAANASCNSLEITCEIKRERAHKKWYNRALLISLFISSELQVSLATKSNTAPFIYLSFFYF